MGKGKNKDLSVKTVANGKEDMDGRNGNVKGNRKRKQEDTKKKEKVRINCLQCSGQQY